MVTKKKSRFFEKHHRIRKQIPLVNNKDKSSQQNNSELTLAAFKKDYDQMEFIPECEAILTHNNQSV